MEFQACGRPIAAVSCFKYLGNVLTASDDDWPAVISNWQKARQMWDRMSRMLGREEAYAQTSGMFYKAFVQAIISLAWIHG